jgi:hypothetical protein
MSMTQQEIVQETIDFYAENPRSVDTVGACRYLSPAGAKCAVGRCLTPEALKRAHADYEGNDALELLTELGEDALQEKYRGHSDRFWAKLQCLHDSNNNWRRDGEKLVLTDKGRTWAEICTLTGTTYYVDP